jgi:ElaB/YqjD/DUF883 family membrane-anchored ribosome-binding protein
MDQGAGRITQDLKDIDQTREAIARKLDLLERRVEDTVQAAKSTVSDVVEKIQETTEDIRGKAEDFVGKTKLALNPSYQIQERPWLLLGGALLFGYVLGRLEGGRLIDVASEQLRSSKSGRNSYGQPAPASRRQPNIWNAMVGQLQGELGPHGDSRSRQQAAGESAYDSGSDFSPEFPRSH